MKKEKRNFFRFVGGEEGQKFRQEVLSLLGLKLEDLREETFQRRFRKTERGEKLPNEVIREPLLEVTPEQIRLVRSRFSEIDYEKYVERYETGKKCNTIRSFYPH